MKQKAGTFGYMHGASLCSYIETVQLGAYDAIHTHTHVWNARTALSSVIHTDMAHTLLVRQERAALRHTGCANCGCELSGYKSEASTL